MPRRRCRKRIGFIAPFTYFKPAGIELSELEEVVIHHDELEALRLKDLLGEPQEEAAKKMGVSQPTFHRLLQSAHQKVADALLNGKAIRIEGGNVTVERDHLPPCGWRRWCWQETACQQAPLNSNELAFQSGGSMKIAISSVDGKLESPVDERFGRCKKFVIYDSESKIHKVIDNAISAGSVQGAGVQASQNVINAGAKVVITGHIGPNAFKILSAGGIEVYTASTMTVEEAIKAYLEGRLKKLQGPDVSGHW